MKARILVSLSSIAASALLAGTSPTARADVETNNLIPNGDFEQPGLPPPGWTIVLSHGESYDLSSNSITGNKALRLAMPVAGTATVLSETCAVTGGEDYLLTFWYRADGMSTKGSGYDGCYANCYLVWQDSKGTEIGNALVSMPYGPVPDYQAATHTAHAPAGAAKALLRYIANVGPEYKGPPTSLFIDQVRLMKLTKLSIPANPQKWEYLDRELSAGLKFVADKDATQQVAIVAEAGPSARYDPLTGGQYRADQPSGEYLVLFRLKVKDNTRKEPVASLSVTDIGGSLNFHLAVRTLLATDFNKAGVYQDFAVRFVRPEDGIVAFRVDYLGATDLWYDKKTVLSLKPFPTDREKIAIWLGE